MRCKECRHCRICSKGEMKCAWRPKFLGDIPPCEEEEFDRQMSEFEEYVWNMALEDVSYHMSRCWEVIH